MTFRAGASLPTSRYYCNLSDSSKPVCQTATIAGQYPFRSQKECERNCGVTFDDKEAKMCALAVVNKPCITNSNCFDMCGEVPFGYSVGCATRYNPHGVAPQTCYMMKLEDYDPTQNSQSDPQTNPQTNPQPDSKSYS
jgi:hypothetical protein